MIDNDETRLLRETLAVEKENNRLLRKMRRDAFVGRIFTLIFWAMTLGVPVVLYYFFVSPYIKAIQGSYQGLQNNAEQMQSIEAKLPPWTREWLNSMFSKAEGTSTASTTGE
jgi:hypothetical protein